jgi:hypothetical protein
MENINIEIPKTETPVYLFFYSKYSHLSKIMIENINNSNLNIAFEYICIDNTKIRNKILGSKKIKFSLVPCIFIVYPNKKIEQYEGNDAFNFVNNIIAFNLQEMQKIAQEEEQYKLQLAQQQEHERILQQQHQQQEQVKEERPRKEKNSKQNKFTSITSLKEEDEETEEENEEEANEEQEESEEDEEANEEELPMIKKPKKQIRINEGNFEDVYDDSEYNPPEYDTKKLRGVRNSANERNTKKNNDSNISNIAQQLAKEREMEDDKIKPIKPMHINKN